MSRPIAARRHDDILKRIEVTGTVSVEELSRKFGVSRETIRRDLRALAERGRVDVVHGGAARREVIEPALGQRARENVAGKSAIGRAAAGLVENGMVVLLDSGTTTLAVAQCLRTKQNLTICTNSLPIAQLLCRVPSTRVHMLGGEIDPTDEAAVGIDVIEALGRFRVDIAFVGAGGLSDNGDVTDYTRTGAEYRARMVRAAGRPFFVLDRDKFGRLTPIRIPGAENAGLILDIAPPQRMAESLQSRGVEVVVATALDQ
jgi:DeoR family transcriptional regulator, glycerol-3-phosphate regulon repressor